MKKMLSFIWNRAIRTSPKYALGAGVALSSLFILPTLSYLSESNNNKQLQFQQLSTQAQSNIHFVKSLSEIHEMGLKGYTLVWYEASGIKYIDDQVISLLQKFNQLYSKSISCPFKIIIDSKELNSNKKPENGYYKKEAQIVIVKAESIKPIPLNRHLSYKTEEQGLKYSNLFERMNCEINEFQQINDENANDYIREMGNRSYESWVVMAAPSTEKSEILKNKKIFSSFVSSVFSPHTKKVMITSEKCLESLGISHSPLSQASNIYIIAPQSPNFLTDSSQSKSIKLNGNKYRILPYSDIKTMIFPPCIQKGTADSLILRFSLDMNQNVQSVLNKIYEDFRKMQEKYPEVINTPKILSFESNKQAPYEIFAERNNFDQIVNLYSENCRYSNQEKQNLLMNSYKWKLQGEMSIEQLANWLNEIKAGSLPQYYPSETIIKDKVKKYNSTQITGEQYAQILKGDQGRCKVIFHYSQHCFSCKNFKHIYEEIAGEKENTMDFYRIDNDFNRTQSDKVRNYNSTPIFVLYKKDLPFYYKREWFTKKLFNDFLEITNEVNLIDQAVLEQIYRHPSNPSDIFKEVNDNLSS